MAHCVKQTRERLKGTGGVDEKHNIRNTGLYDRSLYDSFLSEYLQYFHKKKNEMGKTVFSQVLKYHLNRYYATGVSDTEVEAFVRQEIRQQLHTASRVSIDDNSCDMVSGVISARVTEDFVLPGGFHKSIACDKTILVETEVIEEETETEEIWPQEEEV